MVKSLQNARLDLLWGRDERTSIDGGVRLVTPAAAGKIAVLVE
jgi:hypothetical protein